MIRKIQKKEKGFTLVETLISITILMMSVAPPLYLASEGIKSSYLVKNRVTANYLAQGGYEIVKNIIDNNKFANYTYASDGMVHGFNECFVTNTNPNAKCIVNPLTGDIARYTGQHIGLNSATNVYSYGAGYIDTPFKRYIQIKKVVDNGLSIEEVEVTVVVE